MNNIHGLALGAVLMTAAVATNLRAQTQGEEWEYQGTMNMMGMQMPIPVNRRCEEPDRESTPPVEGNCEVTETDTRGDTTSFTVSCGPPTPMKGSGTTTETEDRRESNFTIKSADGEMSFDITGRRIGDCEL